MRKVYLTTRLTSLPGTQMALTTVLPSSHLATAASAAACISSLEASRATSMGPGGGVGVALAAECLVPQLVGPERADGGKDAHDVLGHAVAQCLVARCALGGVEVGARCVDELHDGRDRGVKLAAIEVLGALGDGAVTLAIELHRSLVEHGLVEGNVGITRLDKLPHDTPGALNKAVGTLDGLGIPVKVLLGRGDKQEARRCPWTWTWCHRSRP